MPGAEGGRARAPAAAMLRDPGHFLAFGAGSGLAPFAPGTFGTLAGLVLYLPLSMLSEPAYLAVVGLTFLAGVPICQRTASALGRHDHGAIVLDEVVGYWMAVAFCPQGVGWLLAGFLAFRVFDIAKPWPIRQLDRHLHGGLGIMLDDAVAALYAIGVLKLIEYLS